MMEGPSWGQSRGADLKPRVDSGLAFSCSSVVQQRCEAVAKLHSLPLLGGQGGKEGPCSGRETGSWAERELGEKGLVSVEWIFGFRDQCLVYPDQLFIANNY